MSSNVTMYDLFSGGKANIWGWIIFLGTIILIIFSIYHICQELKKLQKDEMEDDIKQKELELNLRNILGNKYQSLDNQKNNI